MQRSLFMEIQEFEGPGQTACVGRVGSENGGCSIMETNAPTGRPFWLGDTEREIFSKINWIDYGYFYDLDHKWYYIIPGPFRIKLPLELVKNNLDKAGYEFEYRRKLEDELLKYILDEYRCTYSDFNEFIKKEGYDLEKVFKEIQCDGKLSMYELFSKYHKIFSYFDDWVFIKSDDVYKDITEILVKKKGNAHLETCTW